MCARGSAPGCHYLLAPFLAKEVIFENKPNCLLGSVSVKGSDRGVLLIPDLLDCVTAVSQQKRSSFASEKRMDVSEISAELCPVLPGEQG